MASWPFNVPSRGGATEPANWAERVENAPGRFAYANSNAPGAWSFQGMNYGGMPPDMLTAKLATTAPEFADPGAGDYNHYARILMTDLAPDPPSLASDLPQQTKGYSKGAINLRLNGTRGSDPDPPLNPEQFYGFIGDEPRGTDGQPNLFQGNEWTRRHARSLTARMQESVGHGGDAGLNEAAAQTAERPWTGPAFEASRAERARRAKSLIRVFAPTWAQPAGVNHVVAAAAGARGLRAVRTEPADAARSTFVAADTTRHQRTGAQIAPDAAISARARGQAALERRRAAACWDQQVTAYRAPRMAKASIAGAQLTVAPDAFTAPAIDRAVIAASASQLLAAAASAAPADATVFDARRQAEVRTAARVAGVLLANAVATDRARAAVQLEAALVRSRDRTAARAARGAHRADYGAAAGQTAAERSLAGPRDRTAAIARDGTVGFADRLAAAFAVAADSARGLDRAAAAPGRGRDPAADTAAAREMARTGHRAGVDRTAAVPGLGGDPAADTAAARAAARTGHRAGADRTATVPGLGGDPAADTAAARTAARAGHRAGVDRTAAAPGQSAAAGDHADPGAIHARVVAKLQRAGVADAARLSLGTNATAPAATVSASAAHAHASAAFADTHAADQRTVALPPARNVATDSRHTTADTSLQATVDANAADGGRAVHTGAIVTTMVDRGALSNGADAMASRGADHLGEF